MSAKDLIISSSESSEKIPLTSITPFSARGLSKEIIRSAYRVYLNASGLRDGVCVLFDGNDGIEKEFNQRRNRQSSVGGGTGFV